MSWQTSPAAIWAAVGGHGYRAASAVGLLPALSVVGHVAAAGDGPQGGPTVPSTTGNVVFTVPVALVVTSFDNEGAVQLTEMEELMSPPSATVGWLASLLHSRTLPIELLVKPLPVIVTTDPLDNPVSGVILLVPVRPVAADAGLLPPSVVSTSTDPPATSIVATIMRTLARASRPKET
ncbi:MAG: hypothetical protein P4L20_10000, partial [Acidimicrobiales bacterium]|nr:hypothetical protein [Acidimicrobiales bacterium]